MKGYNVFRNWVNNRSRSGLFGSTTGSNSSRVVKTTKKNN